MISAEVREELVNALQLDLVGPTPYLGLAAFTLILRRLRNPGITGAGTSVLMRYTLRLLTLDQLGRAATLICAMELIRQTDRDLGSPDSNLGDWLFEIGLWVGKLATPNRMGSTRQGDNDEDTARRRTLKYLASDTRIPPIPLEKCPWCGTPFGKGSFALTPPANAPRNLRVKCVSIRCPFRGNERDLPIVAVDDSIYRRLPCFIIATVDKFAALPWLGRVGGFFGKVERYDNDGFYGPCDPGVGNALPGGRLLPPDLIVQDELHLISGPLGTIAGLYEAAIDELSANGAVRPKIIASTATVRKADSQIRALFGRTGVDIFPPPGPDRKNSFFAVTVPTIEIPARLYVGVAAPGRNVKSVLLRVYLALLCRAHRYRQDVERELAILRHAFSLGMRAEPPLLSRKPHIRALRAENVRTGFIDDADYQRLLGELPAHLRATFVVGYHCGTRLGTLRELTWDQVDLDASEIRIRAEQTKQAKPQTIPIYGDMTRWLRIQWADHCENWPDVPFVFHFGKRPIGAHLKGWSEACERAGLPDLHFHDLRRPAVRNMTRAGVSQNVAMAISGHQTTSMYRRYDTIDSRDLADAARMLEARQTEQRRNAENSDTAKSLDTV